jgi:hypothetical protein
VQRPQRRWRPRLSATSALTTAALIGAMVVLLGPPAQADQNTQGVDNLRTNWDQSETALSPAVVQSSAFGQLFATQLDGQVYAQPLVVGNEVIAVTESNTAYGLDRTTGAILWSKKYGPAWPAATVACGDLTPDVGATATPVYDPANNVLYFTTKVDDGTTTHRHPTWLMHAVDPASGAERTGWPVTISGSPTNDPSASFDAYYEQQRPGLLLMDGVVYAGFGAHCDVAPYRGYVVGVGTAEHSITSMWTTEAGGSVSGAGIWQSGGGLVSDGSGRIFFSTGNGISPAPGPGTTVQGTLAESVVRLQVNADRSLSTADFFSPSDAATLDLNDQDISSGAPMALPAGFGTTAHPHLMVQQGKDGRVFLLDRDNLGGMGQGASGGNAVVSTTGPYQGLWGHPAFWGGDGGYVYVAGSYGPLRALKYGVSSQGNPALTQTGQSQDMFGYTSGSPLVTSNGTDSSSALVWMVSATNASGAGGILRAYSPTPDGNGRLQLLWSAPIGTATKFSTPTASGGKVYTGTRDGILYGFGSPARTAVTATSLDFGQVGVGATGTAAMTLTATQDVSITGLTASPGFAVTASVLPTPTSPKLLPSGAGFDVPISFTPTTTGGNNGTLAVSLSDGQKLVFALHGVGTRPGLGAAPGTLDFGQVPTGSLSTLNLQITNTGTAAETINSVTAPTGSFASSGLPAAGTVVPVGGSFVATVTYTPVGSQVDSAALVIASSSAGAPHTVSVPVTGTAITGQGHLTFSTPSLAFGAVPIGSSKSLSFTITNTGNIPVTVTKAKAPTGDFTSPVALSEGLVIGPDQTAVQSVTFTPRSTAAGSAFYEVSGNGVNADGTPQGAMLVPVTGTGTGLAKTVSANDGLWQANGHAVLAADGGVQLTTAVQYQTGSAVYTKPLATDGLRATFTAQFGPGNGGDGITFSLLDPALNSGTALGGWQSGGLGIGGRQGVVVALSTGWNSTLRMQNFVGVGYGTAGTAGINYLSVAKLKTSLRQGTHQVDVQVTGGHLYVSVDGTQVLDTTPTLTATALPAFSGATSLGYDVHTVSGVVIGAPVPPPPPPAWNGYTPVGPVRVLAARSVAAHGTLAVALAGHYGIPANATSVLVDVGVSGTKAATGALTVQPHGSAVPKAAAVSWNTSTQSLLKSAAPRLTGGALDVSNSSSSAAPVYLDVLGYYAPQSGKLLSTVPPVYVLNTTQAGVGQPQRAQLGAGKSISVLVRGTAGVPTTATSVVLNLATGSPGTSGGLVVWPHGAARPGLSELAWTAHGDQASNLVTVPIGVYGRVDLYNTGTGGVDVVAGVVGYYAGTTGKTFVPTTPSTVLDTRSGVGRPGTAPLAANGTLTLLVAGQGVVPTGATAVLVQLGTVPATGTGSLTAWTDGTARPSPANIYWNLAGHLTTNLAVIPLPPNGRIDLHDNGANSVAVTTTVLGYWTG